MIRAVHAQTESSEALFGKKSRALEELREVVEECGKPEWGGEGTEAVAAATWVRAQQFIRAIPDDLPMPEMGVDPDGEIAFDWALDRVRSFSVSIDEGERLACAWLDGTDRGHFVASMVGGMIPQRVIDEIYKLASDGSGLRVA